MFTFKIPQPFSLLTVLTLINYFSCIYAKSLNFSKPAAFSSGVATFYAGPGGGQGGSGKNSIYTYWKEIKMKPIFVSFLFDLTV